MSNRVAYLSGKVAIIAALAVCLTTFASPAFAQFSVEWVQLGGTFRVAATRAGPPNAPLCVHGLSCSCPGSRNYCGQHRNGAEVLFWKDGCNRPPMTIQCVIRQTAAAAPPPAGNQQEPFGQNFDGWSFSQAPDKTGVICRAFAGNGFIIGRLGDGKVYVSRFLRAAFRTANMRIRPLPSAMARNPWTRRQATGALCFISTKACSAT
jgi:hypothetical protein